MKILSESSNETTGEGPERVSEFRRHLGEDGIIVFIGHAGANKQSQ